MSLGDALSPWTRFPVEKQASKHVNVLVKKTGLEVNGPCRASPPCLVFCPSPSRLFVLCRARTRPKQRASCRAGGPRVY
jgi:hypothetical protein